MSNNYDDDTQPESPPAKRRCLNFHCPKQDTNVKLFIVAEPDEGYSLFTYDPDALSSPNNGSIGMYFYKTAQRYEESLNKDNTNRTLTDEEFQFMRDVCFCIEAMSACHTAEGFDYSLKAMPEGLRNRGHYYERIRDLIGLRCNEDWACLKALPPHRLSWIHAYSVNAWCITNPQYKRK